MRWWREFLRCRRPHNYHQKPRYDICKITYSYSRFQVTNFNLRTCWRKFSPSIGDGIFFMRVIYTLCNHITLRNDLLYFYTDRPRIILYLPHYRVLWVQKSPLIPRKLNPNQNQNAPRLKESITVSSVKSKQIIVDRADQLMIIFSIFCDLALPRAYKRLVGNRFMSQLC